MSIQAVQSRSWSDYLPNAAMVQRGLMLLTIVTSILSSMPTHRMAGALGLRCTSLASASVNALSGSGNEHWVARIAKCTKVASVALGLAGLYASIPVFTLTPVLIEPFLQILFLLDAGLKGDFSQRIEHAQFPLIIGSLITNIAAGIAFTTSSQAWMIAACLINCFFMTILSASIITDMIEPVYNRPRRSWADMIHAIGYLILGILSGTNPISQIKGTREWRQTWKDYGNWGYWTSESVRVCLDPKLYPTLPITGPTVTTRDLR